MASEPNSKGCVELRLIGSKADLKAASSLLYSTLGAQFAMKNIYKGEKGDFVARAQIRLKEPGKA